MYAVVIGMMSSQPTAMLIAWPLQIGLYWWLFGKFKLTRFAGFILIPPVVLLGFQFYWSATHAYLVADRYVVADRSHYVPGTRVKSGAYNQTDPDAQDWSLAEVYIGVDGFRADPATGVGNPKTCRYVLIGDSMIYGSGLVYAATLGPTLKQLGLEACVFGVTGNSPADYLATLKFVAERVEPGALIAFYLYAYNDFVGLSKYATRRARGYAARFPRITERIQAFDIWRRSTIVHAWFHSPRTARALKSWQYPVAGGKQIKISDASDPQKFAKPPPLNDNQKKALKFFFDGVSETAKGRNWRIVMLIHPDNSEIYANLAGGASALRDLDPRRADGLAMCKQTSFICGDLSSFLYERAYREGNTRFSPTTAIFPSSALGLWRKILLIWRNPTWPLGFKRFRVLAATIRSSSDAAH